MTRQPSEKKLTLVIAEDEFIIAQDVADTAKKAGFEVVGIAGTGEDAIDLVLRHSPDAVILDIQMPKMNGLEAARRIRDETGTPVVIMTAYESDEVFQEAKLAGVGAYLIKPPKTGSIQRAVELAVARNEDLVELSRTNRELRDALLRIKTLEGILPICSSCHKIRDGQGDWQRLEAYISRHTEARFSHSVCPDCEKILYPDFADL